MAQRINTTLANLLFASAILVVGLFAADVGVSASAPLKSGLKHRAFFGKCPAKVAGELAITLLEEFEKGHSLRDVKIKMEQESLISKHFLSEYSIKYDPVKKFVTFSFDCPEPFMKVQIYKENGLESYEAILVDNGELYDPTYEVMLKAEKKLKYKLPYLAIPVGDMDKDVQHQVTSLIRQMKPKFRGKLSEVILNDNKDLTIILSVKGRPSSAFLGNSDWSEKVLKLQKIVAHMVVERRIPTIINLTNSKKVVVKFNDKF